VFGGGPKAQLVKRCIMCYAPVNMRFDDREGGFTSDPIGGTFLSGGGGWKSYSSREGGSLLGMIWSTRSSWQRSNLNVSDRPNNR
jgi:hypothetical protein